MRGVFAQQLFFVGAKWCVGNEMNERTDDALKEWHGQNDWWFKDRNLHESHVPIHYEILDDRPPVLPTLFLRRHHHHNREGISLQIKRFFFECRQRRRWENERTDRRSFLVQFFSSQDIPHHILQGTVSQSVTSSSNAKGRAGNQYEWIEDSFAAPLAAIISIPSRLLINLLDDGVDCKRSEDDAH